MALSTDKVTDAQLALVRQLAPRQARLSDTELRNALATTTALVPQRDPATREVLQGATGPLTEELVDPYAVLADLWELEGIRLGTLEEQPRRVTSESNGDISRSYEGGGPMTSQQAYAVARRLRRRALSGGGAARTVTLLPPNPAVGYGGVDPTLWQPAWQEPGPAPLASRVNRAEPRT